MSPGEFVELSNIAVGMDVDRFTAKARHYLKAHEDHVVVHKLRLNQALTPTDLTELQRILTEVADGDARLVAAAAQANLAAFVRSLVGLDRSAAKAAFSDFITRHNLDGDQINFVNLVVDYLTQDGMMPAERLYESPFTDISPSGVGGVFSGAVAQDLIAVVRSISMTGR